MTPPQLVRNLGCLLTTGLTLAVLLLGLMWLALVIK